MNSVAMPSGRDGWVLITDTVNRDQSGAISATDNCLAARSKLGLLQWRGHNNCPCANKDFDGRLGMIFEQIATGGCQSYLVGCEMTGAAVLIDPEHRQIDRYIGLAHQKGVQVRYIIDTHTHADHFSGSRDLGRALSAPVVMYRTSPAP
jgi:phosphoribosyl 1,2-cyclic phosphodiesterase